MPETIDRPCSGENINFFLKKDNDKNSLVKTSSILDSHGFNKYVLDKEFGKKVI